MVVTVNVKLPSGVNDELLPALLRLSVSPRAGIIWEGSVRSLMSPTLPVEKTRLSVGASEPAPGYLAVYGIL